MTLNVVKFTSNMKWKRSVRDWYVAGFSRPDAYLDSSKGVMYPSGNGFKSIDLEKKRTTNCRLQQTQEVIPRFVLDTYGNSVTEPTAIPASDPNND